MLKGLHYTYMHAYIQRNYTYKSINDYDQLVGSLRFLGFNSKHSFNEPVLDQKLKHPSQNLTFPELSRNMGY